MTGAKLLQMNPVSALFCAILLLIALCVSDGARSEGGQDTGDDALIRACLLDAYPQWEIAQTQSLGHTAAAILLNREAKMLCVLEKQAERWTLVISNEKALLPIESLPQLRLDTEDELSWTYELSPMTRFAARRAENGEWGTVGQKVWDALGNGMVYVTSIGWREQLGAGHIVREYVLQDERGIVVPGEHLRQDAFPAPWLEDCVALAAYDAERFPCYVYEEYSGQWPDQAFIRDAAARLMPDCVFVGGTFTGEHLQFLLDKPDGARVFVGYIQADYAEPYLIESTPLPVGTCYGVENFTDSLGVGDQCVDIVKFDRHPWWGVQLITQKGEDLSFGFICVFDPYLNRICIGYHPWNNITTIDWGKLPRSFEEAVPQVKSDGWAVVHNPDPKDRLHLRSEAGRNSKSLGKYYNGTPVSIYEIRGDWAHVEIFGQQGWMLKTYLDFTRPLIASLSAMPVLQFRNGFASLYGAPENNADSRTLHSDAGMRVIGLIGDEWAHVWFPLSHTHGFIRMDELTEGNG